MNKKDKTGWLLLALKEEVGMEVCGRQIDLSFSKMADGCAGIMMVFNTKEAAAEYAGDGMEMVKVSWKGAA